MAGAFGVQRPSRPGRKLRPFGLPRVYGVSLVDLLPLTAYAHYRWTDHQPFLTWSCLDLAFVVV